MHTPRWRPARLTITVVIAGLLVTALVWPQLFGLQRSLVFAQLVAFRIPLALAALVGAVLCAAVTWWRKSWGIAAALALVLAVGAGASSAIVLSRVR